MIVLIANEVDPLRDVLKFTDLGAPLGLAATLDVRRFPHTVKIRRSRADLVQGGR